ncbi:MAG: hesB/YadR/YfhF protein [Osedax symbiont Rs1]|nr:MAG: hesB/YadR/YfhF protein [Osedax symbiont Rs1]
MSNLVPEFEDPLKFSDSAVSKVKTLIEEEENDALKLRLYITGGGCAGFSYGFSFIEDVAEDDTVISKSGVSLVVDAMSLQYLTGSEVDYREGLQGSQFIVNNPNATTTCGCGSSFSL